MKQRWHSLWYIKEDPHASRGILLFRINVGHVYRAYFIVSLNKQLRFRMTLLGAFIRCIVLLEFYGQKPL